jgi:hypothetical protein
VSGTDKSIPVDKASEIRCEDSSSDEESTCYDSESESSTSYTEKSIPVDKASEIGCEDSSSDEESTCYDSELESSASGTDKAPEEAAIALNNEAPPLRASFANRQSSMRSQGSTQVRVFLA